MLADPEYQASLRARLIAGKAPHMETLLHYYAWGKPKDKMAFEIEDSQLPEVKMIVHHLIPSEPGPTKTG